MIEWDSVNSYKGVLTTGLGIIRGVAPQRRLACVGEAFRMIARRCGLEKLSARESEKVPRPTRREQFTLPNV